MDLVTGYVRASAEPSRTLNGETPTLVGLGVRHAAYAGNMVALCGQSLAHLEPATFGPGGLGAPVCAACTERADRA